MALKKRQSMSKHSRSVARKRANTAMKRDKKGRFIGIKSSYKKKKKRS